MQRIKDVMLSLVSASVLRIPDFILLLMVCMVEWSGNELSVELLHEYPVLYGVTAVTLLATRFIRYPFFIWGLLRIRKREDENTSWKVAFLFVLVQVAASLIISPIVIALVEQLHLSSYTYAEFAERSNLSFVKSVIIAPVVEECLFRDVTYFYARKIFPSEWVAIIYQALLFGIMHMNAYQGVYTFFMGLLIGYCYKKTGNLKVCIAMHAANNLMHFL